MANLSQIVKVTKAQMDTLIKNGSIDGHTLQEDVLYAVESDTGVGASDSPRYTHVVSYGNMFHAIVHNTKIATKFTVESFCKYLFYRGFTSSDKLYPATGYYYSNSSGVGVPYNIIGVYAMTTAFPAIYVAYGTGTNTVIFSYYVDTTLEINDIVYDSNGKFDDGGY